MICGRVGVADIVRSTMTQPTDKPELPGTGIRVLIVDDDERTPKPSAKAWSESATNARSLAPVKMGSS